jgi:hypothetical protein
MRAAPFITVTLAVALAAAGARADGAFPDSMQVLLPPDQSQQLILSTNFGLVISVDDGASWRFVCELAVGAGANLYQLGPLPTNALFAVSQAQGLSVSRDVGCHWSVAGGSLAGARALDAFPDPTDAKHVLALATLSFDGGNGRSALLESHDGGQSFGAPLFVGPAGGLLTGVEIARASPQTIYLTGFTADIDPKTTRAFLVRSTDGGASFQTFDESPFLSTQTLRIAAVDPSDATKLYLRVLGSNGDSLALSTDGGVSLAMTLALPTAMSAFLRRSDGTLLVGTRNADLFVSSDGGTTFSPLVGAPHLRGLAERAGTLYAAADSLLDGFALAASDDGGSHWTPVLRFPQIQGPLECGNIATECAADWQRLSAIWNPAAVLPVDPQSQVRTNQGCSVGGMRWKAAPLMLVGLALIARRRAWRRATILGGRLSVPRSRRSAERERHG